MKSIVLMLSLFGICLQAAEITVLTRNGQKLPADQQLIKIELQSHPQTNGVETIEYRLTSLTDQEQYYRIRCSTELTGRKISIFDGLDNLPPASGKYQKPMLLAGVFPLAAAWTDGYGIALAAGAEDHHSFLDLTIDRKPEKAIIMEEVSAALLKKGSVYQGKFHIIRFSPKYGERDALARYYKLYPKRFLRNPEVDSRLYGTSASYASWFRSNPEWARFSGGEWEWCLHAGRHWGDISGDYFDLPHEKYVEVYYFSHRDGRWDPQRLPGMSKQQFREFQKQRLSDGYYCGVANAYYTTGASRIHHLLGRKFSDSLETVHPRKIDHGYDYAASVFAFPETSWGKEIMRMFRLVAERDDISAIAFDIPLESEIYRGEKLREMSNVGFDQFGPGIARAVANSKLCEQINRIPTKYGNKKLGTVINVNGIHQINDCFYADNVMAEANPWQHAPPWPRSLRYAMGEKGATFWEGYHLEEFNPNQAKEWTKEERGNLLGDLCRYVAHRSFLYGITYPASFTTEYLANLAPAMQACNQAGYKVVPGMKTRQKEITLTRYGTAEQSLIAICNLSQKEQVAELEIFPDEFRADQVGGKDHTPLLFAGFLGGTVTNIYQNRQEWVNCSVAPLRVNILEAAGSIISATSGRVQATWQGGFQMAKLTLHSNDFQGKIKLKKQFGNYILDGKPEIHLKPNDRLTLFYHNKLAQLSDMTITKLPLLTQDGQPRFSIYYATDPSSRDMAERVLAFFRELGKSKNTSFKLRLKLIEKSTLPRHTIAISLNNIMPENIKAPSIGGDENNLVVSAENREELSRLTRIMLNVLNHLKYPEYIYGARMNTVDRGIFQARRF